MLSSSNHYFRGWTLAACWCSSVQGTSPDYYASTAKCRSHSQRNRNRMSVWGKNLCQESQIEIICCNHCSWSSRKKMINLRDLGYDFKSHTFSDMDNIFQLWHSCYAVTLHICGKPRLVFWMVLFYLNFWRTRQ